VRTSIRFESQHDIPLGIREDWASRFDNGQVLALNYLLTSSITSDVEGSTTVP